MALDKIISILPLFFIELAVLVSLLSFRDNFPFNLKRLSLLWIFMFLVEITGHITGMMKIRNFWLYTIFDIIFFLSLAFIFYQQLNSRLTRSIIRIFCIVFSLFAFCNIIFIQKLRDYNSFNYITGGTFIILLAVVYFRKLYEEEKTDSITGDPFFWFSTGFLIYFGSTVPFLGMYNLLLDHYPGFTAFYHKYVYVFFTVLLNILIAIGFLCRKNYPKTY